MVGTASRLTPHALFAKMQALPSWLISQGKRTTVYQDWSSRQAPVFLRNFESSPAVLKLRNLAANAETFLRRHSIPVRASKNVKDQIDVLRLRGTWRHPGAPVRSMM